jgi:hypothetical protein
MPDDVTKREPRDDLLWGTQEIADFIGVSLSEAQYLIREKKLPIGRLGPKRLFASRRELQKHLTSETQLTKKSA